MGNPEGILGQDYWQTVKEKQDNYARARAGGKWALNAVRPSIFNHRASKSRQLRETAYLDGLRGFAALLVYIGHHELWAHDSLGSVESKFESAYGYQGQRYFVTLPYIRTFFAGGHYAVSVFFVISGYVLSTKPLQYVHSDEHSKLAENLSSALFRRWIRLFIPVACTTFIYMCSWHMGVRTEVEAQRTFREELWKWCKEFRNYSFLYGPNQAGFTYSFHVWSIPTEFRGSIIVYTCLLAFSRLRRNARLACTVGLLWYFIYCVDGWYCAMFVMGMLLSDIDRLAAADNLPFDSPKLQSMKQPIFIFLFVLGVWLGGCPASNQDVNMLRDSPGWYYLSYLKPEAVYDFKWFFLFWAATLTVVSIPRIALLKGFFESRFNQYLGRISYAFYLVHGPLIWTVADRLYAAVGWTREAHGVTAPHWINLVPLPNVGPLGLEVNFLAAHLLILPITLWLGELVTKLFDEPSVKFAQWFYKKVTSET